VLKNRKVLVKFVWYGRVNNILENKIAINKAG